MLGYFNNWKFIRFSYKATSSEDIEKIHQFVLYGICDNMATSMLTGQYGAINTKYTAKMGYYAIKFLSKYYTLKEDIT